ncbi:MAG: hypothetical protein NXI32_17045 [bacterium]|nr:hypothetical protein [bacterium]
MNPDHSGTPIGVIVVPTLALTVGVVACYLITGIFAMPVIFYLDKIQKLNALTIITTALSCLAGCIAVGCAIGMLNRGDGSPLQVVATSAGLFLLLSPFVLASAITFWWIQRQGSHGMSFRSVVLTVTLLAAVLALSAPILRRLFS